MHRTSDLVGRHTSTAGRIAVFCVVFVGAGFGCSTASTPFVSAEDSTINIEVDNRGFQPATLHVIWSGRRLRLGTVSGTLTANYTLPWSRSEVIQIEIDLLAGPIVGPECTTRPISAEPGDIIYIEITNQLLRDPQCFRGAGQPG